MIVDARSLDNDTVEKADVCIIGAGPACITMLRRFRESGMSVIVLESGDLGWDSTVYYMNEGERFGVQRGDELEDSRWRGLGGTAAAWELEVDTGTIGARYRPLEAEDFAQREWIPGSGWPITYEDLLPHYERAQEICGLGQFDYDSGTWMEASEGPLIQSSRLDPVVFQGGSKRPFTEQPLSDYGDANDVRIFVRATAHSIDIDHGDTVSCARATDPFGRNITIHAGTFVFAGGGIENARLLLKLRSDGHSSSGITSKLLGRTFMEHIHVTTGVLIPEDPAWLDHPPSHSWHTCRGKPIQWKYRLSDDVVRAERIAQYCMYLRPCEVGELPDHLKAASATAAGVGQRVLAVEVMSEQIPNPASRVELSDRPLLGLDLRHGTQARLYWELSELDLRTLLVGQDIVEEELTSLSLGKVVRGLGAWTAHHGVWTGHHHMGTTRMSHTPEDGVVDSECRVHGLNNLYVAGSSVFSTGGFANPTLTAVALSDRLATHITAYA